MAKAVVKSRSIKVTAGNAAADERDVAVEMPVALVYDGTTQAVMMASPIDLASIVSTSG